MAQNSFEIPTIHVYRNGCKPCGYFGDFPLIDVNIMDKPYPLINSSLHTVKDFVFGPYIDFSTIFGETEKDDLPTRSIDDFLVAQAEDGIAIYDRHYHLGSEYKTLNEINWLNVNDYRRNLIIFSPILLKLPAKFKEFQDLSWSPATKTSAPITPTQSKLEIKVMNLLEDYGFGHMQTNRFLVPTSPKYKQFDSSILFKRRESGYSWLLLDSINNTFKHVHYQVCIYEHESDVLGASELAGFFEYAKSQREEFFKRHYSHCHSK
ncbi:MAG: hypothetical protein J6Y07_03190 [Alphaproteobacteria bacterium]|nr:hypothetical protein [Alphaproteobacteria bacterium]